MRNLFGWSSPPKRKDRKYSRLRAAALQDLISAKAAHQIWVDIEEHGDGYVIPLSILNIIAGVDGTVTSEGHWRTASVNTTGTTGTTLTVGSDTVGEHIEVHHIQASFQADATVADRSCSLRIPSFGTVGVSSTTPNSIFYWSTVTLSASQYGFVTATCGGIDLFLVDNGSVSQGGDQNFMPLHMTTGGTIKAIISANGQAGDKAGLDIVYRVLK